MKGIGFFGAGNMGEALIRGILSAKLLPPKSLVVRDLRTDRVREMADRYGVTAAKDPKELLGRCETVVIAVKPQTVPELLRSLSPAAVRGKLVLSIAAGIPIRTFLAALGEKAAVVRAMPNTPAQVLMGSTGLCFSPAVTKPQKEWTMRIFAAVGTAVEFPREELLDVVTALSGSGPAYAFLFIEALADGAVRAGMTREDALLLAASTVEGAARMVRETGAHPGALKDLVTSPGGTTAAGLAALERGAFRGTVLDAVDAAWKRCRELSR
jgi:pyrroline-5-carboxylate reductase